MIQGSSEILRVTVFTTNQALQARVAATYVCGVCACGAGVGTLENSLVLGVGGHTEDALLYVGTMLEGLVEVNTTPSKKREEQRENHPRRRVGAKGTDSQ